MGGAARSDLEQAARFWAARSKPAQAQGRDTTDEDIERWAPPENVQRALTDTEEPEECEVLAENLPAAVLFLALSTQWDRAGLKGVRVGLNYTRIAPVLRAYPHILREEAKGASAKPLNRAQAYGRLFARLQIMEGAALAELHRD